MRRTTLRKVVIGITILAILVFAWKLATALFISPTGEIYAPWLAQNAPAATAPSTSFPSRFMIPKIDVDAHVQHVGIKADGSMANPNNFTDVGWYKYGVIPGQVGSAAIAGHVDNGLRLPGVFKRLNELEIGDDVYVEQKDGSRIHFKVVDIKSFPYESAPKELIFGQFDRARLNLITCEGEWIKDKKTYADRLVVFTRLVAE